VCLFVTVDETSLWSVITEYQSITVVAGEKFALQGMQKHIGFVRTVLLLLGMTYFSMELHYDFIIARAGFLFTEFLYFQSRYDIPFETIRN